MTFGMGPTFHFPAATGNDRPETFTARLPAVHLPDLPVFGLRVR
jgi:hypothetical protein